jgi:hypothetical protein
MTKPSLAGLICKSSPHLPLAMACDSLARQVIFPFQPAPINWLNQSFTSESPEARSLVIYQ